MISADLGKAFHEGITGLIAQEPATTRNTLTGNDWLMVEQGSGHSCEENDDSSSYDSADQHPMRNNECSSYDEGHGEIGGERIEDILLLA